MHESPLLLLCRAGEHLCAIPIEHVTEIMRPLPTEPLAGTPSFVAGIAVVRGVPTPVVGVEAILGMGEIPSSPTRYVAVRLGTRQAALVFDAVLGVRALPSERASSLPPLLQHAAAGIVTAIASLDTELLLVLEHARVVPEVVWAALDASPAREERT